MTESTPPSDDRFTFHIHDDGYCEITVTGEFLQATSLAIAKQAQYHARITALPGILLNLSQSEPVSMVRLSGLLDMLSRLQIPLAVVFLEEQQLELACVLHHTLVFREYVAYFTTIEGAWVFLRGQD